MCDTSGSTLALLPLLVGLEAEAAKPPTLGLCPAGLTPGLPTPVFARFLAALDIGIPVFEFVDPFNGLLLALPSAGVSGRSMFFEP